MHQIEVVQTSFICTYYSNNSKFNCKKLYVVVNDVHEEPYINDVHWHSGKALQSTNWVVNTAIRILLLNQINTNTGTNEIVLKTWSSTGNKSYFKS